ncbi:MAG: ABC transporter permease, partial [Pseudoclavibacter sp.]
MSQQPTTPSLEAPDVGPAPGPQSQGSFVRNLFGGGAGRFIGLVVALILLIIVGAVVGARDGGNNFLTFDNALVILRQASVTGVVAIGMTFVIIAAGIDLSVGAVLALAGVMASIEFTQDLASSTHWIFLVIFAIVTGFAAGLVNWVIIAFGKVAAFMATLAM